MSRNRCQEPGGHRAGGLHQAAHGPDQRGDVGGGDAGAHGAGRDRTLGQFADRGADLAAGGRVLGPRQEQVGVPRVVGEGLAERAEQFLQAVPAGAGQRPLGGVRRLLHGEPDQLVDQRVLAGELAVDGADAHAGPGRDLLHARVGARFTEHLTGRVDDAVVVADRVTPRRPQEAGRHAVMPAMSWSRTWIISARARVRSAASATYRAA
jgi:hypothetical protein